MKFLFLMSLIVATTFSATANTTIGSTKFFGETKFLTTTHFVPVTLTIELTRYVTVDRYSIPITKLEQSYTHVTVDRYSIPITKPGEMVKVTNIIKIPDNTKHNLKLVTQFDYTKNSQRYKCFNKNIKQKYKYS